MHAALLFAALAGPDDAKDAQELVLRARTAFTSRDYPKAVEFATKAEALDPKNADAPLVAGAAHLELRENAKADAALTRAIALDPKRAAAYDRRGDARLKLARFPEAVADFDKFLELQPKFAPEHWRRGIALYYAGRFADGVKQFELHRTANPEDVENAVWHYLCNARATTPKQARAGLIPVTKDGRVPMPQVLALFGGTATPADVLKAAEDAKLTGEEQTEARFYAHLYVALYHESEGDAKPTLAHLTAAVERYKIGHYMWDVGNAHLLALRKK